MTTGPLAALRHLFDTLEHETTRISDAHGLRCPTGCGACCLSPEVEATELEMLPMARHLFAIGEGEVWLERLAATPSGSPCVLYRPDPHDRKLGRCGYYAHRPTLCRLFAFAARRNRDGGLELAACRVHKETAPEAVALTQEWIAAGGEVPVYSDTAMELYAVDPHKGTARFPINEALQRALATTGLALRLEGQAAETVEL